MPEYFDISLIAEKFITSNLVIDTCLHRMGLVNGKASTQYFKDKTFVITYIDHEEEAFEEIFMGFEGPLFDKEHFDQQIETLTSLVTGVIKKISEIKYALCSYEINGFLLGEAKKIEDIDEALLNAFPVVFKHNQQSGTIERYINHDAQDLF